MPFIPTTSGELDDFIATIPPKLRENADFRLGRGLTEQELRVDFGRLAESTASGLHFLGGGFYDNVLPARSLVRRAPVDAPGDFQSVFSDLTGMDVTIACEDGMRALVQAILLAGRINGTEGRRVLMASSISPELCWSVHTLLGGRGIEIDGVSWRTDGALDLAALERECAHDAPSALVVGFPNAFGIVEPIRAIKEKLRPEIALVVYVADPAALSIFEAPGALGADIVAGDARQFGNPPRLGGPSIGFLCGRSAHRDEMPDLASPPVGQVTDFLETLGVGGFTRLGETVFSLFEYLRRELDRVGIPLAFGGQHFREGVFEVPNLEKRFRNALDADFVPGIPMGQRYPARAELAGALLVTVSAKHQKADIDRLVEVLSHG